MLQILSICVQYMFYTHVFVCFSELRRSGRFRGKQLVVEENTFDDPIDANVENNDDDFQPDRLPNPQAGESSGKRMYLYTIFVDHVQVLMFYLSK